MLHGEPHRGQFEHESLHDAEGQWWRSRGNELWELDEHGLMRRDASTNDYRIGESERRYRWERQAQRAGRAQLEGKVVLDNRIPGII